MEINTTTQTTNTYTQTKQKDSSPSDGSFDELMNTQNQQDSKTTTSSKKDYIETSDTTTQTQTVTYTQDVAKVQDDSYDPDKKFLNFLDENYPGYFEKNGISKEDEEAIRNVLNDNEISEYEAKQLSFEQSQTLHKIEFSRFDYGPSDMLLLPVENNFVQSILGATGFSKDDILNEAIHKTIVENYTSDSYENNYMLGELSYTLKQAYEGMELGFNYHQAPVPFGLLHEFETKDLDYEQHFLKILSLVDTNLSKEKDPGVKKHLEDLNKGFGLILENYQEIKK